MQEQIVKGLSAWDANKFTIVQHESEWYDKAESKSIFETLLAMFKEHDMDLPAKLEHEKERVNKLIWMQDESKIGLGKHVWSWWPVIGTDSKFDWDTFISRYEALHSVSGRDRTLLTDMI
jgi:hypothetical protein